VDRAGNIQTVGSIGNGNAFIVTLPASQLQVIVTTTTAITAGTGRDITVKALDNGGNIAITYTGTINFNMDAGAGPETPGSGDPHQLFLHNGRCGRACVLERIGTDQSRE